MMMMRIMVQIIQIKTYFSFFYYDDYYYSFKLSFEKKATSQKKMRERENDFEWNYAIKQNKTKHSLSHYRRIEIRMRVTYLRLSSACGECLF